MNKELLLFSIPQSPHNHINNTTELTIDIMPYYGGAANDIEKDFVLNKTPWVPQKNDKVYFLPGVNIPRIKFKNLALEYNIKTVREPSNATVVIGSKASLYKMSDRLYLYTCTLEDFKKLIAVIKNRFEDFYLEKIESSLEFYTNDTVLINYNTARYLMEYVKEGDYNNIALLYFEGDNVKIYKDFENTSIIYDESAVISLLNGEDATEIDATVFEKLCDMLSSSDTDNHILAMEIMANSKYIESLIYTELLFYKYSNVFFSTHTKNHVNFKSLTSYLNKSSYFNTTIDDIVNSLKDKDQFNTTNLDILLNYCHRDILRNGESQHFTIKTISLKEESLEQLDENYTYSVQKDYVKVNSVQMEEVEETAEIENVVEEEPLPIVEELTETVLELEAVEETTHIEDLITNTTKDGTYNIDWF